MGDNPKGQKKDRTKTTRSLEAKPSDFKNVHQGDTCGISFSKPQAYEKHQKKVTEVKLMDKNLYKESLAESDNDDEEEEDEYDVHCDVCSKSFPGYLSYLTHVKGRGHAKNLKKQKLKHQLGDKPEVLQRDSDAHHDEILSMAYARCKHCDKEFSGPEPYKMHLNSAVHKKKLKQAQMVQSLIDDEEPVAKNNSDNEEKAFSRCEVCQKSFSGVMPYKIHMQSAIHKKTIEKKKVAEELKEFFVEQDGSDSAYVCRECKKSFSDPMAFKCHLENNSHEKQKAKSALQDFLNAHPEIAVTYTFEEDEISEDDENDATLYFLICKLCHVSFSGPESAKDHVKSKKHISLQKEKRLAKLVKEKQKGKYSEESDEKNPQSSKIGNKNSQTSKNDDKIPQVSTKEKKEDFVII